MLRSKKDFLIAVAIGIASAAIWMSVFARVIGLHERSWILFIIFPALFMLIAMLGERFSSRWQFARRFAKFVMIGILNAGIDFAVFNLFLYTTSVERGPDIIIFKTTSFAIALLNSYYWNKFWVFGAGRSYEAGREFVSFVLVTATGLLLNVGVTSFAVNLIGAPFGMRQLAWDNAAAGIASVAGLIWNFVGYHYFVFRKALVLREAEAQAS